MKTLRILFCALLFSNGAFAQFEFYNFHEDGNLFYLSKAGQMGSDTIYIGKNHDWYHLYYQKVRVDAFHDTLTASGTPDRVLCPDDTGAVKPYNVSDLEFSYSQITDPPSLNISNWNTAFGWGNHASAGYLTGITSGQVTTALGYVPLSTEVDGSTTNELAPAGTVSMFAGASAPEGYLMCNGSAVSRTTYAALFAIVGTTYGSGDGSTTFNLPDLRQRFPIGVAASGTGSTLGGTGGTIDHLHTVDPPSTTSSQPTGIENVTNTLAVEEVAGDAHTHAVDIAQFNSGTANPPFIALNFIIKH